MRAAQLRLGRDIARWATVLLVVSAILAAIYSVPAPTPFCSYGPFPSTCFNPGVSPFTQYSPILFIGGALVYVLARKADNKMKDKQKMEELETTSTTRPSID